MSEGYSRKKQPELVRRALLDETANIAARDGLAAVTIDAVAKAAGVTKGGLFHHFPSKQALLAGVFSEMLMSFDERIDARMAKDPEPVGRFTRAYVEGVFDDLAMASSSPWAALAVALMSDADVRKMWSEWFSERIARHAAKESLDQTIVRLAADGAWYACVLGHVTGLGSLDEMKARLIARTRGP
ncbi:TetR/AcrR family transcriptional regulator [Hansschlegelia beijingensis]